jgi:hypothetical protein
MNRPPSDLGFLFAIGIELSASFEALFHEFSDRLGDEADEMAAIRTKIEHVLAGFGPRLDPLEENVAAEEGFEYASSNLSDLSDERSTITNEIIRPGERIRARSLMLTIIGCLSLKRNTVLHLVLRYRRSFRFR